MGYRDIVEELEKEQKNSDVAEFEIGDTISVHQKIVEGEKERVQIFTGTVIARTGGGVSETFSIHRVAYGEGMERVFPLHSPRIVKIEVTRKGKVRRAKLYNLRGKSGKAAKVKERIVKRTKKSGKEASKKIEAPQTAAAAGDTEESTSSTET